MLIEPFCSAICNIENNEFLLEVQYIRLEKIHPHHILNGNEFRSLNLHQYTICQVCKEFRSEICYYDCQCYSCEGCLRKKAKNCDISNCHSCLDKAVGGYVTRFGAFGIFPNEVFGFSYSIFTAKHVRMLKRMTTRSLGIEDFKESPPPSRKPKRNLTPLRLSLHMDDLAKTKSKFQELYKAYRICKRKKIKKECRCWDFQM